MIMKYVDNPQLFIDLAGEIIDELNRINSDDELRDRKIQLHEINKAIKSLEVKNIPVPDGLRNEKIKLVGEINTKSTTSKLQLMQNGFEELLKCINIDEKKNTIKKRERSNEPKTDNATLRDVLIQVLKEMGGKGKVKDIKVAMESILKDKFLPGDLLLRSDGRTIAWFNNVRWERLRMVDAGILRNDSNYGCWELTGDNL